MRAIRHASGLIAALLLLCALPCPAAVPAWVQELARQPAGTYSAHTDAEVLLDELEITVNSADEYVEHTRRVVRILRPDGRGYANCVNYYSLGDKVLDAAAWVIAPSGRDHEVKRKEFSERARFNQSFYDDLRMTHAALPSSEPGSVIACEFQVRKRAWFQQERWAYQERIPVREARMRVTLPAGWEYRESWSAKNPSTPTEAGPNSWQWVRRDVPALDSEEEMRPAFAALAERMELAYFPAQSTGATFASWSAIGNWYYGLARERRVATPEIREQARLMIAGLPDFDSRLHALTAFLQTEVRYFGIEVGIGGWQPHFAADIFRSRYGDCKDKATLLSVMLQEAGIDSEHVLVHTEHGAVRPDAPSVGFNHVISSIRVPDSVPPETYPSSIVTSKGVRYIIFDPTDEYTPVGSIRSELQGNHALLALERDSEMFQIPLLAPEQNRLERHGRFRLTSEGVLEGEIEEQRVGDQATDLRSAFATLNEMERSQWFQRRMGADLGGVSIRDLEAQALENRSETLTLRYAISAPQYMQKAGPLLLVRPRVLGRKSLALDWNTRQYPVSLPGSTYQKDVFEIELPEGYGVDELPAPIEIDVGFASYKSQSRIEGSVVRYTREYTVRDPLVNPEKFKELERLHGAIAADEQSRAILEKQSGPPGAMAQTSAPNTSGRADTKRSRATELLAVGGQQNSADHHANAQDVNAADRRLR